MSYFEKFKDIYYSFDGVGLLTMKDITFNVRPLKEVINNYTLFEDYTIQDGDTPHIVSERIYGTPNYHWVIMLINDIYHHIIDWPMSENQLETYVKTKYGEGKEYDTHEIYGRPHWVNSDNIIIDPPMITVYELTGAYTQGLEYPPWSTGSYSPSDFVKGETVYWSEISHDWFKLSGYGKIELDSTSNKIWVSMTGGYAPSSSFNVHTSSNKYFTINSATAIQMYQSTELTIGTTTNTNMHPVSNYDYETSINDKKRKIRLIHPSLIGKFVADLESALNG